MSTRHKELSIQITLSGFSFSIRTLDCRSDGSLPSYDFDSVLEQHYSLSAYLEWSTPATLILPLEVFDHSLTSSYLESCGLYNADRHEALFAVLGEYVAVWAVDAQLYNFIKQRMPSANHTNSLLDVIEQTGSNDLTIVLDTAAVMHLAYKKHGELVMANSMKITTIEDVLFYLKKLEVTPAIISIGGENAQQIVSLTEQYYPEVRLCE